jgi:glycine cleavage system H protein
MQPQKLKFTKDHEWVGVEGDQVVVGITNYAQKTLGDLTFVELPKVGRRVAQHDALAVVESVKAASDVYAPLSGTVVKANEQLAQSPELINQDPCGAGWICRLDHIAQAELDGLLTFDQYEQYLAEK